MMALLGHVLGLRHVLVIFLCLLVVMGWAANAGAHRRGWPPLVNPPPPQVAQPPTSENGETSDPSSLKPEAYWKKFRAQEQAGEYAEAWKTGLALANLFPPSPQRGAALLKLAGMAKAQGKPEEALELFGLVVSLDPGSQEASLARLTATALEFDRELNRGDPVQTLRRFLERVAEQPSGYAPGLVEETLRTGWQAVTRKVQAASPLPLSLVEELLALWDLQPKGLGPPEAAHLLAEVLRKKGLWGESRTLLAKTDEKHSSDQQHMFQASSLEMSWLSRSCLVVLDVMDQFPEGGEQQFPLGAWRPPGRAWWEPPDTSGGVMQNWFWPRKAHAGWWEGKVPPLTPGLLPSWTALPACRPKAGLAEYLSAPGDFLGAAPAQPPLADSTKTGDQDPFYQDRQGLSRLKEGQLEAAQATYQELAQNHDPFWQLVARVRLADLELSRLGAEVGP